MKVYGTFIKVHTLLKTSILYFMIVFDIGPSHILFDLIEFQIELKLFYVKFFFTCLKVPAYWYCEMN